jgi:hypothetical protein
VFWNESAAECAAAMTRHYKSREVAIEQAHAYDVEAYSDEERAYWRAVLVELRACNEAEILRKTQSQP